MVHNNPRLSARTGFLTIFALAAFMVGCDTAEPRYTASRLAFDPGLVGWWEEVPKPPDPAKPEAAPSAPPESPVPFEIVARKAKIENGRFSGGENAPASSADAYIVRLDWKMLDRAAPPPHDPEHSDKQPDRSNELWMVMLEAGDERLIGVQPRSALLPPFLTPYHMIMRIKREGDVCRVWMPELSVVWMPQMQLLDAPDGKDAPSLPTREELEKRKEGGHFLTFDPDRLLAVYSRFATDPKFWQSEPVVLNRVPAPEKQK